MAEKFQVRVFWVLTLHSVSEDLLPPCDVNSTGKRGIKVGMEFKGGSPKCWYPTTILLVSHPKVTDLNLGILYAQKCFLGIPYCQPKYCNS
jgi:hypothetical protein